LLFYFVVIEIVDWAGRIDTIATRFPRLAVLLENRKLRLILLLVGITLIAKVIVESPTTKQETKASVPIEPPKPLSSETPTTSQASSQAAQESGRGKVTTRKGNSNKLGRPGGITTGNLTQGAGSIAQI